MTPAAAEPGDAQQKSEGVWHAAWRRFTGDRVGFWSLLIVACFLVVILLSFFGMVARDWQKEVGVPNAPPTLVGAGAAQSNTAIEVPKGPNVRSCRPR